MKLIQTSQKIRARRHRRLRSRITGTPARPRLAVFRSLKHISAQLIDDTTKRTLLTVSDQQLKVTKTDKPQTVSAKVGEAVAKAALEQGLKQVVFDRGGYAYHGRVKALAEAARTAGLEF